MVNCDYAGLDVLATIESSDEHEGEEGKSKRFVNSSYRLICRFKMHLVFAVEAFIYLS